MMSRRITTILAAGVLVAAIAPVVAAQDEELRMGDDPAYAQRVEVPEAGIALTIPADWTHEVVMEPGEYQLPAEFDDGSAAPYTIVSSATLPDGSGCILSTYEDMPMSLERHALERGQENTSSFVDGDPVISEVQRSAGPAVRVDFQGMLGWGHEYLFDMVGLRYVLSCFAEDLGDETFRPIADSIELLDTAPAEEPDTTDPAEASIDDRRVEFPEFGVGLTIPHFWTYELRREETEYPLPDEFGEDARVPRTQFLSAFPFTDGVCWVSTYADMPMDPERHAREHGWAQYSSLSEADPETERVQLPAGEAYRVVYYSLFGGSVAYVFDLAGSRYLVDCVVGSDGGFAARSLAASVSALGDEPPELGLQRMEFADAGIAVTLPVEWEVQSVMDFIDTINVAGPDAPESDLWVVMSAFPDEETSCDIYMLGDIPLSLEDHGHGFAALAAAGDPPREAEVVAMTLPIGDAVRVTDTSEEGTVTTNYLFDVSGNREYLRCSTFEQPEDAWLSVAESIESLSGASPAPEPEPATQRIEVPEAGLRLALPVHWEIASETESMGPAFLPEGVSAADVEVWKTMTGYSVEDQEWCSVYVYDGIHLSLDDHATWFEELDGIMAAFDPELPSAATETGSLRLPIGDAATYTQTAEDGDVSISYLFDLAGNREYLVCGGPSLPDDGWLSVAETIVPLGVPDDAVGWSEVTDIVTVLPVTGAEEDEAFMHALCEQVLWIEYADGWFEERLECVLTDEPVDPPEGQGDLPQGQLTLSGGECEWVSDFWIAYDGSEHWASSWSVTVEPEGNAVATAWYAPEEIDCVG